MSRFGKKIWIFDLFKIWRDFKKENREREREREREQRMPVVSCNDARYTDLFFHFFLHSDYSEEKF